MSNQHSFDDLVIRLRGIITEINLHGAQPNRRHGTFQLTPAAYFYFTLIDASLIAATDLSPQDVLDLRRALDQDPRPGARLALQSLAAKSTSTGALSS